MEYVLRALFIYVFLMVLFAISGKRSMAQMDTFDFILLLIISEATQQALLGQDFSVTTAAIVILTLVGCELFMSKLNKRWPVIEKSMHGGPLLVVRDGVPLKDRLNRESISEDEILTAARLSHGLEKMDQIKFAILENNGDISIVPKERIKSGQTAA